MGKPDVFSIEYDDPNGVYKPGQRVTGHVDLQLSKGMKTSWVSVTLYGSARTQWTEFKVMAKSSENWEKYASKEEYVNIIVTLWDAGINGNIKYYCRAKIHRSWRFDYKVKEMFTVIPMYDLNLNPSTGIGISAEDSKELGFCCYAGGRVSFQINVPKTGYVPGECITVTIDIDNQASQKMESAEVRLVQVIKYTAEWLNSYHDVRLRHTKCEHRTICSTIDMLKDVVAPSKFALKKSLTIPPVVASMGYDSIIQVEYILECNLKPTGMSGSRKIHVPIIVGTVPLRLRPSAPPINFEDSSQDAPPANLVDATVAPPPSYEECMFGKVDAHDDDDDEHTRGNFAFAPRYPVFHF